MYHGGSLHTQLLPRSVRAVPSFLLLLFASPVVGKIPTATWTVPWYWMIWRADLQRYPEAKVKKKKKVTLGHLYVKISDGMKHIVKIRMVFLTSSSLDWFPFRTLNIKGRCHFICTYFILQLYLYFNIIKFTSPSYIFLLSSFVWGLSHYPGSLLKVLTVLWEGKPFYVKNTYQDLCKWYMCFLLGSE